MTFEQSPGERAAIRAPRGTRLSARSWQTEAPLRMLMNNLDPDVAERPDDLVVYGGIGRAARNWPCYAQIVDTGIATPVAVEAGQRIRTALLELGTQHVDGHQEVRPWRS